MRFQVPKNLSILGLALVVCFQLASFQRLLGFNELLTPDPVVSDDY